MLLVKSVRSLLTLPPDLSLSLSPSLSHSLRTLEMFLLTFSMKRLRGTSWLYYDILCDYTEKERGGEREREKGERGEGSGREVAYFILMSTIIICFPVYFLNLYIFFEFILMAIFLYKIAQKEYPLSLPKDEGTG